MSKFCSQCGAAMEDDALFCMNCGAAARVAPVEPAPVAAPEAAPAAPAAKKPGLLDNLKANPKKTALFGGIAVAVIAVIVVLCVIISRGNDEEGSSPETAVALFMELEQANASKRDIKAMAPPALWEYVEEKRDITLDDIWEYYEDEAEYEYEDLLDYYEGKLGSNVRVTYKITDKNELDEEEVKELALRLKSDYGIKRKSVTEAYEIDITITIKGANGEVAPEYVVMIAMKIDGKWYSDLGIEAIYRLAVYAS